MKNLQYISDSTGQIAGVFIPIQEWNELKIKYQGIEQEQLEIPSSQVQEVRQRLADYAQDPTMALDFDETMEVLEKTLADV